MRVNLLIQNIRGDFFIHHPFSLITNIVLLSDIEQLVFFAAVSVAIPLTASKDPQRIVSAALTVYSLHFFGEAGY